MQIIITIAILIAIGIVVGSNLLTTMSIVILDRTTIALPIGIWLAIALGAGLLTSSTIQILLILNRRLLKRQIRKQQSRNPQPEEDIFTYRDSTAQTDNKSADREVDEPQPRKNLFNSYRAGFRERFSTTRRSTPTNSIDDEDRDWDERVPVNRQQDWEDSIDNRSPNRRNPEPRDRSQSDRNYSQPQDRYIDSQADGLRREVYDADFRLIQPPYKQPTAREFEDEPSDSDDRTLRERNFESSESSPFAADRDRRSAPADNLDDEDWGFDFDDDDAPTRAK